MFKRGDTVIGIKDNRVGIIQGPEDFDGYERNRYGTDMELVLWVGYKDKQGEPLCTWIGKNWIKLGENDA